MYKYFRTKNNTKEKHTHLGVNFHADHMRHTSFDKGLTHLHAVARAHKHKLQVQPTRTYDRN